jgi:hypothetical protein
MCAQIYAQTPRATTRAAGEQLRRRREEKNNIRIELIGYELERLLEANRIVRAMSRFDENSIEVIFINFDGMYDFYCFR